MRDTAVLRKCQVHIFVLRQCTAHNAARKRMLSEESATFRFVCFQTSTTSCRISYKEVFRAEEWVVHTCVSNTLEIDKLQVLHSLC